ncbi:MAG: M24 family metallopeptidase C-terminal domain-containing protein [Pseudomonadota bacterium]
MQTREEEGQEVPMLEFDPVTFVPFDRRLIETDLLTEPERVWVDAYHRRIHSELALELLSPEDFAWLEQATQPL